MSSFQIVRPWIAGIGLATWLAASAWLIFYATPTSEEGSVGGGTEWDFWGPVLSWALLLALTGIAPVERQGLFVRYGAMLGIAAVPLALLAGFLLDVWFPDGPLTEDQVTDEMGLAAYLSLFSVTHLVALSAIHLARFHVTRRWEGNRRVLVIRLRRPGKLALSLRVTGMLLVASAAVILLWTPIILFPDPSAIGFLNVYPWFAGAALLGVGLLFLSRFADANGPKRARPVVKPNARIVVEPTELPSGPRTRQ